MVRAELARLKANEKGDEPPPLEQAYVLRDFIYLIPLMPRLMLQRIW